MYQQVHDRSDFIFGFHYFYYQVPLECYYIYYTICLEFFSFKVSATCDFTYYISMFITTVAFLCYGILFFDTSSLPSYVLHFISSFNSSYNYLIAACHFSSLKADWLVIHRATLCTDDNFNDYNLISSQVFQWWYSFSWPCHVEYMCNVYKWYKTHAVLSPWSPTDYSTMLCKYILQHLLMYYLEYIFLNWLPYWYILLFYFYFTLIYVLLFLLSSLLIISQERGGCYPGLT